MIWFRNWSRRILGPYLPYMATDKAEKYMAICRMVYFFSASSIGLILLNAYTRSKEKKTVETGIPVIQDHSHGHKLFREGDSDKGVFYTYVFGKGTTRYEMTKDEYYAILEKEALERAIEAQKKALEEGKELPKNAIRLV